LLTGEKCSIKNNFVEAFFTNTNKTKNCSRAERTLTTRFKRLFTPSYPERIPKFLQFLVAASADTTFAQLGALSSKIAVLTSTLYAVILIAILLALYARGAEAQGIAIAQAIAKYPVPSLRVRYFFQLGQPEAVKVAKAVASLDPSSETPPLPATPPSLPIRSTIQRL
jgi:hypothetical protein